MTSLLRRQRRALLLALTGSLGHLITLLSVPLITRWAVDHVLLARRAGSVPVLVGLLLTVAAGRAGFGMLRKWEASRLMAGIGFDLRNRMYAHVQRLSFGNHERLGRGPLLTRVSSDVTMLETVVAMVPFFAQSMVVGVMGAAILVVISPLLALSVVTVTTVGGLLSLRLARPLHHRSLAVQSALDRFAQFAEQEVSGIRIVKGHALEAAGSATGHRKATDVAQAGAGLVRTRARFNAAFLTVPGTAVVTVLGVGGWLGAAGRMTVGDLLAFIQYLGLLITPIVVTSQVLSLWPQARAALDRVAEVLDTVPDVVDLASPVNLPPGPTTIALRDVWFGYGKAAPVLRGVSLTVPGGTSVALVGISGSGKTTVTRLVPRFYDVWSGEVTIDGVDVRSLTQAELRASTAIVFEDAVVFSASIEENIAMAAAGASPDRIRRAAQMAKVDEFADRLPAGYATPVGDGGASLSGGQRQRLAIARALLRDPRILILDDATSALDPHLSEAVRAGLAAVMKDRTTLIVAHHVDTVLLADRVVLLDGGRVVASGTHDELMVIAAYREALGLAEHEPARRLAG